MRPTAFGTRPASTNMRLRFTLPLASILLAAGSGALIGCDGPTPKPPDQRPPAAAPIAVDQLSFEVPEQRQRFFAFDKAVREFAGPDFEHRDYHPLGGFVQAAWAKGVGLDPWLTLRGRPQADVYRLEVKTIVGGRGPNRRA